MRCSRTRSGRVIQRCHNSPRWETGLASANNVMHRKRTEDFGRFWKRSVSRVESRHWTRRVDFWGSQRPDEFARYGRHTRWGADGKAIIEGMCISPYVEEPLNSKVIKTFVPEQISRKCFSGFEILCSMLYIYEHYMSISHIAVSGYGTLGTTEA